MYQGKVNHNVMHACNIYKIDQVTAKQPVNCETRTKLTGLEYPEGNLIKLWHLHMHRNQTISV